MNTNWSRKCSRSSFRTLQDGTFENLPSNGCPLMGFAEVHQPAGPTCGEVGGGTWEYASQRGIVPDDPTPPAFSHPTFIDDSLICQGILDSIV